MLQAVRMFPHDATAKQWFIRVRWPQGPHCPHCGAGSHRVQSGAKHETMPFRRRDCRKHFSVRSGTVMHLALQPGLRGWAMAIYRSMTSLKQAQEHAQRGAQATDGPRASGQHGRGGAKDRATKYVAATDEATLQGFMQDHADRQERVYTDECQRLRDAAVRA